MCGETWRGGDRSRKEAADEVRGAETGGQQDPISQRLTAALPPPPPAAPSRAHLLAVTLQRTRGPQLLRRSASGGKLRGGPPHTGSPQRLSYGPGFHKANLSSESGSVRGDRPTSCPGAPGGRPLEMGTEPANVRDEHARTTSVM